MNEVLLSDSMDGHHFTDEEKEVLLSLLAPSPPALTVAKIPMLDSQLNDDTQQTEINSHVYVSPKAQNSDPSTSVQDNRSEHAVKKGDPTSSSIISHTSAGTLFFSAPEDNIDGLKDVSADPPLFSPDINNIFGEIGSPLQAVETQLSQPLVGMPTLSSPFEPTGFHSDAFAQGFPISNPNTPFPLRHEPQIAERPLLTEHLLPNGRRRSQSVPPGLAMRVSFQPRRENGDTIAISRPTPPTQALLDAQQRAHQNRQQLYAMQHNSMQAQLGASRAPTVPSHLQRTSFPMTPPPHIRQPHPGMGTAPPGLAFAPYDDTGRGRAQSGELGLRRQISTRERPVEPERRRVKKQKHHHPLTNTSEPDTIAYYIEQLRDNVEYLFREGLNKMRYEKDDEVERARAESRLLNSKITNLDQHLETMASREPPPVPLPLTGHDIRNADTTIIQSLLDFYHVPFVSTMFLPDKKALYLRFVGAGRMLMHLVLD